MSSRRAFAALAFTVFAFASPLTSPAFAQQRPPGAPQQPPPNPNEKTYPVRTTWTLREMNGKPVPAGVEATLTIDDRFRGTGVAGCNNWSATMWPVRGQRFAVGPVVLTKKSCPAPIMAFERSYLTTLHNQSTWDIVQGFLDVKGPSGTLRFARGY
ncbi:MAG: META domain-containing protein [Beijerinckiaceae bacterium]|nr:META domain-containing protein [Beijerinckiaceae bacterium]MDO9441239.1 META domain-containing protein [Beijerinckiaceae bacterium]